jgi:predicted nucleotidyltransferase
MRSYKITLEQALEVFKTVNCNCCQCEFTDKNPRHVHHTVDGYRGVLCQKCNLIIGKETEEDLHRIQSCLNFVSLHRENFTNRDNQQGSLSDPSTTARRPRSQEQVCNKCLRSLSMESFRVDRKWIRKTCKHCEVCLESARQYGISYESAFELYSKCTCDCCKQSFTATNKVTIHHIGD